jgi:hypothetical protein
VNVRQTEVPTRVAVSELFVIEAEEVQNGGMQVVHVDLVLHRGESKLIGAAV